MKRNTMRFYAQVTIVGVLAFLGLVPLCCEPTEDANFILTFIGQLAMCGSFWFMAWRLAKIWHLDRKFRNIKF